MRRIAWLILLQLQFLLAAPLSMAADDGDSLTISGTRFRLDGVDAPELDQVCLDQNGNAVACGMEVRKRLEQFINARTVLCEDKGADPVYEKRRIGICAIEGENTTINQWLVRNGWAINFEPYAKGRFVADEAEARKNLRGLWKGCFVAPRDFRRWNKASASFLGTQCSQDPQSIRNALFPDHPNMPPGCSVKGSITLRANITGHRGIYHVEGCRSYARLKTPNRWFCSEEDAKAAGFRKAFNC